MSTVALPLDSMTLAQKMDLLERVWDSIASKEKEYESPVWHGEELKHREENVRSGKTQFIPWGKAKEQIRQELHGN